MLWWDDAAALDCKWAAACLRVCHRYILQCQCLQWLQLQRLTSFMVSHDVFAHGPSRHWSWQPCVAGAQRYPHHFSPAICNMEILRARAMPIWCLSRLTGTSQQMTRSICRILSVSGSQHWPVPWRRHCGIWLSHSEPLVRKAMSAMPAMSAMMSHSLATAGIRSAHNEWIYGSMTFALLGNDAGTPGSLSTRKRANNFLVKSQDGNLLLRPQAWIVIQDFTRMCL